ncbi:hypothetical protein MYX65_11220 [Acidobacteria bacterium AH-259-L09]|nr:hypothetical protein [Acidobacteria bacterium AH-259-L09]
MLAAGLIIVPALVLAEVDYFPRDNRAAMRKLVAEIFDPGTRYDYKFPTRDGSHQRLSEGDYRPDLFFVFSHRRT